MAKMFRLEEDKRRVDGMAFACKILQTTPEQVLELITMCGIRYPEMGRDLDIYAALLRGQTTTEVGIDFQLSASRIAQIENKTCKQLVKLKRLDQLGTAVRLKGGNEIDGCKEDGFV